MQKGHQNARAHTKQGHDRMLYDHLETKMADVVSTLKSRKNVATEGMGPRSYGGLVSSCDSLAFTSSDMSAQKSDIISHTWVEKRWR